MKNNMLILLIINTILTSSCNNKIMKTSQIQPAEEIPQKVILAFKANALLGEGAFWNYKTQELYWVDIEGRKLHRFEPSTKSNKTINLPSRIGTVVPYTASTAIVALEEGIYQVDLETHKLKVVSDIEKEMTFNRFNDGKCDPGGNLWVGSMHLEESEPLASVYKITEDGSATKMIDSVTISNGIVWNKDASTMFYIDTPSGNIQAYDYDVGTATISNERTAVRVSPKDGFPDGMAIDEEDMLWVGLWNGNAVARYNPQTGEMISKIEVPAHNVTACAFGGALLDKLYITTATVGMTDKEKEKYPDAGSVFVVRPGVKGVKSTFFGKIQ